MAVTNGKHTDRDTEIRVLRKTYVICISRERLNCFRFTPLNGDTEHAIQWACGINCGYSAADI
jgi:hypothetical protein